MDGKNFLETQIVELQRTVQEGFAEVKERLTKMEGAMTFHATADTAAQTRVSKLEDRIEKLEPVIAWFKGSMYLVGVLTLLLGLYKLASEIF